MGNIDKQFRYFLDNQDDLVRDFQGKAVVLKDDRVQASFDDGFQAFLYGRTYFPPGTFIIQRCVRGKDAYTASILTPGVLRYR